MPRSGPRPRARARRRARAPATDVRWIARSRADQPWAASTGRTKSSSGSDASASNGSHAARSSSRNESPSVYMARAYPSAGRGHPILETMETTDRPDRPTLPPIDTAAGSDLGEAITPELLAGLLADGDDELAAWALANALEGAPREVVYDGLLRDAMALIGSRWRSGEWGIAEEHAASQALTRALDRIAPRRGPLRRVGPLAVVAGVRDERHTLGLVCLAHVLEDAGWTVVNLGGDEPPDDLARFVGRMRPGLVGLTASDAGARRGRRGRRRGPGRPRARPGARTDRRRADRRVAGGARRHRCRLGRHLARRGGGVRRGPRGAPRRRRARRDAGRGLLARVALGRGVEVGDRRVDRGVAHVHADDDAHLVRDLRAGQRTITCRVSPLISSMRRPSRPPTSRGSSETSSILRPVPEPARNAAATSSAVIPGRRVGDEADPRLARVREGRAREPDLLVPRRVQGPEHLLRAVASRVPDRRGDAGERRGHDALEVRVEAGGPLDVGARACGRRVGHGRGGACPQPASVAAAMASPRATDATARPRRARGTGGRKRSAAWGRIVAARRRGCRREASRPLPRPPRRNRCADAATIVPSARVPPPHRRPPGRPYGWVDRRGHSFRERPRASVTRRDRADSTVEGVLRGAAGRPWRKRSTSRVTVSGPRSHTSAVGLIAVAALGDAAVAPPPEAPPLQGRARRRASDVPARADVVG